MNVTARIVKLFRFVLLKERNMLLTMEEAYKEKWEYFPNPERIDKVEDSMSNLESVVRERNRAYYMLETGTTGERPARLSFNALGKVFHIFDACVVKGTQSLYQGIPLYLVVGLRFFYRMRQYNIPKFMNTKWRKRHMFGYGGYAVQKFLKLYREKLWNQKRKSRKFVLPLYQTFISGFVSNLFYCKTILMYSINF